MFFSPACPDLYSIATSSQRTLNTNDSYYSHTSLNGETSGPIRKNLDTVTEEIAGRDISPAEVVDL